MSRTIYVVNKGTLVNNGDIATMTRACGMQLMQMVSPDWNIIPPLLLVGQDPPKGADQIVMFDESDQAGALGYHELAPDGSIYGKVFSKPSLDNGGKVLDGPFSVASVLSHELIEAVLDAFVNFWVDTGGLLTFQGQTYQEVALEACDPVESDDGIVMNTDGREVWLSNYILPAWLNPDSKDKVDRLGRAPGPFQMSTGGYVIVRNDPGSETQVFGEKFPEWKKETKKHPAARTWRRGVQL